VTRPAAEPPADPGTETVVRGPYFEELATGQVYDAIPPVTLTSGMAAAHQAITGERTLLPLSEPLAREVLGAGPVAPAALVWSLSIGQSSEVTQNVRANLYYRGLMLRRLPNLGDTLATVTRVTGLRQNRPRPGRAATGLARLHITTADQDGATVLDYERCAMIPLRDPAAVTGQDDDLTTGEQQITDGDLLPLTAGWALRAAGPRRPLPRAGQRFRVAGRDVVTSAPELARLTMNVAAVHHDASAAGGRRLVYGGHAIALALAQAGRAIPNLLTVIAWHSCDHVGPVHEGDLLASTVDVERVTALPGGGAHLHLRSRVTATDPAAEASRAVLDWRFVAVCT